MKGIANRQKLEVQPKSLKKREVINFKKMNRLVMKRIMERLEKGKKGGILSSKK